MNEAVICRSVVKNFGTGENEVKVLRGVDFDVHYGEMTFLVGPSGCGKTTLLSVIAGLLNATAGDLRVLGTDLAHLRNGKAVEFRRKNLGFVFQQFNLLPALTAAENAAIPLLAAGWNRRKAVDKAVTILEDLGLGHRVAAKPNQLSGGQQQRVAFARALIHEPRLVVCDEPTSALDADTGHHVMDLLRRIAVRPDRAVLVVTHDSRIFPFADRIAHMNDGLITNIEKNNEGELEHVA
ncbi:MAG: ABC transporter ATP-binding protein [Bryobacterales bacterium]|nr:ABC transporter ATP-binding protein [Bryobacterales bacterium]